MGDEFDGTENEQRNGQAVIRRRDALILPEIAVIAETGIIRHIIDAVSVFFLVLLSALVLALVALTAPFVLALSAIWGLARRTSAPPTAWRPVRQG
jgi:hypothetical protein